MKAVCWQGKGKVGVETVADPGILNPRDAIIEVSSAAICGSDLHLYNGKIPSILRGDILGHEFMGKVVAVGSGVKDSVRLGERVVVPFNIACGACVPCTRQEFALCDNSNPNAWLCEAVNGASASGLFGYTHLYGGYAGGQAEFVRVPFADCGTVAVPPELSDEQVLFLTDILPTGYMAAENANIKKGDIVAIWGCGPVGQMAIKSAWMLGASRVFAIDSISERLAMAEREGHADVINWQTEDVQAVLQAATGGTGPDACIEAVGMEAHGTSLDAFYDAAKQGLHLVTDRLHALRQAIQTCRKGGTLSIPGVYAGFGDKLNLGAAFAKGLTVRMGQTHTHRYVRPLLQHILDGDLDPSFVISHRFSLDEAPAAYEIFNEKRQGCTKVVLKPGVLSDCSEPKQGALSASDDHH